MDKAEHPAIAEFRSWHSVAEVLGEDNDPRLSINGCFHSSRRVKKRVRSALTLPRVSPSGEADISFIFNSRILVEKSKTSMRSISETEKELLVRCAFQECNISYQNFSVAK
ncbi:hypothetical protein KIN20_015555 [Parelaphostrongylus tenuis]|uniref:Uncharacterized protein n=1 Tax=Parelaphostrongylus tenuis TaxID=148309 RepID=A0AAD5MIP7_PARTN|nr:hypothetical protein KIN20_015555 [Parelaphostrongylus tenuis]